MSQIITIVLQDQEENKALNYFMSDGLDVSVALAAIRSVEAGLQKAVIEAEVQRRVAQAREEK